MTALSSNRHWHAGQQSRMKGISPIVREWLFDSGSLTRRLMQLCGEQFQVQVISECAYCRINERERALLAIKSGVQARIREVFLCHGDIPLVFARTVIPLTTLRGEAHRLAYMGGRPIGALLFSCRGMIRGPLQISKQGASSLHASLPEDEVWGRRSLFYLSDKPLLVSEFFLPSLFEKVAE